jgi:hypothetical protein
MIHTASFSMKRFGQESLSNCRSLVAGLALCGAALVGSTDASQASFVIGLESTAPAGITELSTFGQGDKNVNELNLNIGANNATELTHVTAGLGSTVLVDSASFLSCFLRRLAPTCYRMATFSLRASWLPKVRSRF